MQYQRRKIQKKTIRKSMSALTVLFGLVCSFVFLVNKYLNGMRATEIRAQENAQTFIEKYSLQVKRMTCGGDSNKDGYGTCNLTLDDGEKISLKCPTGFFDVVLFGAKGCKEEFRNINLGVTHE